MERWFWDEYVWTPRVCLFPFRAPEEFSAHMAGARIAMIGDSTIRGTYADIVNWLRGIGPETLQAPGYEYDATSGESSWDGIVAGFNPPPLQWDAGTILPNPVEAPGGGAGAPLVRHWGAYEAPLWADAIAEVLRGDYDAVVLNFGLWWSTLCQVTEAGDSGPPSVAEFVRRLLDMLLCKPQHRERLGCSGRFGGRIVYRGVMGKFDIDNYCNRGATGVRVRQGLVCKQHDEVLLMLRQEFSVGEDGDLVLLDAFNITFSRPDRSIDSFHFSPRKCAKPARPCGNAEARSIIGCCWEANRFPHSASLSHTNVLINMLWDDPIVLRRAHARLQKLTLTREAG